MPDSRASRDFGVWHGDDEQLTRYRADRIPSFANVIAITGGRIVKVTRWAPFSRKQRHFLPLENVDSVVLSTSRDYQQSHPSIGTANWLQFQVSAGQTQQRSASLGASLPDRNGLAMTKRDLPGHEE